MIKTPKFWQKNNITSKALTPTSWIYDFFTKRRIKNVSPFKSKAFVVCVGNIAVGGSGKTPLCLELADFFHTQEMKVFFLSRGYKSRKKYIVVDSASSVFDVGDEPLLLAKKTPTIIAPDRIKGAKMAENTGADVIIMDDGLQNPYLYKDFSIITIDGGIGFGNNKIFPAGPLRETIENASKRANAIIIIGKDETNVKEQIKNVSSLPIYDAEIIPNPEQAKDFKDKNFIAFAGIGRPEKFYNSLKNIGGKLIKTMDFPDHHHFSNKELNNILKIAKENDAIPITTQKDYVRLDKKFQEQIKFLEISIKIDKVEQLHEQINKASHDKA